MKEIEILSGLTKDEFDHKVKEFSDKYGKPRVQKRLGIILTSYEKNNKVDTRVKITNGKIHIVQKTGGNLSSIRHSNEENLDLDLDAEDLVSLIRILQNMGGLISGFTSPLQRFENFLFDTDEVEVKFYHQYNDENSYYGFELELKDENLDIHEICRKYDLPLDNIERGDAYWTEYDKKYNQDSAQMKDEKLLEIIKNYLDYNKKF